jgi:hypothetical protein
MTDWNKAKVIDLRAELKKRGLPQTGLKPALVARLIAAENEDGTESETTVQGDSLKLNASAATSPDTVSPTQPLSADALSDVHPQSTSEPNPESSEQTAAPEREDVNISKTDAQTEPLPSQSANTIESSQPPSQPYPERSALPSAEPQEVIEDQQKRKRRSESPPISAADAARKRFRKSDEGEGSKEEGTVSKSDSAFGDHHNAANEAGINATSGIAVDILKEDLVRDGDKMEVEIDGKPNLEGTQSSSEPLEDSPSRTRDSRFKDLFNSPQTTPAMGVHMEKSKSRDSAYDEAEPERIISPAIHPATAALYIRDFMRPLNSGQLKSYLANLATPPGRDINLDGIIDFYLDPIRTHAFVSFNNISAASRVRSALHDRIWPDERTRKPLWVDFIPTDKVKEWIEVEESSNAAGRGLGKKWEIHYDVDEDRHVTASIQEASNMPNPHHSRKPSVQLPQQGPPLQALAQVARRGIEGAPSGPRAEQKRDQIRENRAATNLATLDQLFRSTTAKPLLYWQPVSKSVANQRLDAMEDATSKRYPRGGRVDDDINRYTFEDGHVLVDRGPELFGGIRPPRGFRGPGRGGTTRIPSTRGGYSGGGDRGDRVYDSYRGGGGDRRGSRDDGSGRRDSRDERRY